MELGGRAAQQTVLLTGKADTAGESWLILGSDEREGTIGDAGDVTGFRTDTILVLTKPKSGSSSLISIPRDSLVEIDQNYMKINAVAQLYSGKQLVNEVEDITGRKSTMLPWCSSAALSKWSTPLAVLNCATTKTWMTRTPNCTGLPVAILPTATPRLRSLVCVMPTRKVISDVRPVSASHQRHSEKGRIQEYASELR